jgi:death-on-curing protein
MLNRKFIDTLHALSIHRYGGSIGIRDEGMLESAIARPFQTFGGEELYPTVFEKTAAIGQSLIMNHPYVDGNKRTGLLAMIAMLELFGYELIADPEDTYQMTIKISTGEVEFEELSIWIEHNCRIIQT